MALTQKDCYILLMDLQEKGIDTSKQLEELITADSIPLNTLKFINSNKPLDVINFYDHIRKSYNQKKSNLYINIMKEKDDPTTVLTTLSAMSTQILLFSKKAENSQMFLKHVRLNEIYQVLLNYTKTYDLTLAIKLLKLIKLDIKALESIYRENTQK